MTLPFIFSKRGRREAVDTTALKQRIVAGADSSSAAAKVTDEAIDSGNTELARTALTAANVYQNRTEAQIDSLNTEREKAKVK